MLKCWLFPSCCQVSLISCTNRRIDLLNLGILKCLRVILPRPFFPREAFPCGCGGIYMESTACSILRSALSPVTHKSQLRELRRDPRVTLVYRKLKSVTAAFGDPPPLNYVLGEHGGVLLILSLHGNSCEGRLAFCCLDLREGKQCGGCHSHCQPLGGLVATTKLFMEVS